MTEATTLVVRKPRLDFGAPIERFYLGDNAVKTHLFNALNLLFPDGERFFVKSVHDHVKDLSEPQLVRDARAFAGQEGQHAHQHERFFTVLAQQGYSFEKLLDRFQRLARWSKVLPRSIRLSITAGAEHYTATMAALLLESGMLERCNPVMRDLMTWHALEEIEHKNVAYDVLVACYPKTSYPLRIIGFIAASVVIAGFTFTGLRMLLVQDGRRGHLSRARFEAARAELHQGRELRFRRRLRAALLKYFVPGFHPSQQDDRAVLETFTPRVAEIVGS
jgi:predicted metal-dependent hydrolase